MNIGFARHFFEFKRGIAPICVSGVPYVAPFSSLKTRFRIRGPAPRHVITVCDSAAGHCSVFPGAPQRIHGSTWDPGAATSSHEERLAAFRRVRDDLASRLRDFYLSLQRRSRASS
jgi:hypothetical protein